MLNPSRRHTVKANSGNFVINLPVSEQILTNANYKIGEEFTHCKYTAVSRFRADDKNEIDSFPAKYQLTS
jgi:hypothetical protein